MLRVFPEPYGSGTELSRLWAFGADLPIPSTSAHSAHPAAFGSVSASAVPSEP